MIWIAPHIVEIPDYMNVSAFDFWSAAIRESAQENGAAHARIDRDTIIARAETTGIPRRDMDAALAIECHLGRVAEKDGVVTLPPGRVMWPSLSEQRRNPNPFPRRRNDDRATAYLIIKDVIERRADGRPSSIEPLVAFSERLDVLGFPKFRLWWSQLVSELKHSDPETTPAAVLVFAAALVEGSLTFVAKHARGLGLGLFGSTTFDSAPYKWRFDDLVNGAAAGGADAILDNHAKLAAAELGKTRQRIHAGRMLEDFPQGVPDLKPEQARAAKHTVDMVVRRIIEWLVVHPVP